MRLVILALCLCGCSFDGDPVPQTPEECTETGGKVVMRDGNIICDSPPTGTYAAASMPRVSDGTDGGTRD